jgi:hypothetical protein
LTNPAGGQLKIDNGGVLNITGSSIVNNGTFTMNGSANATFLEIDAANVTLSGSGTLTLSNFGANAIGGSSSTNVLTNQETIQGAGNIGDGQIGLNNQGTIDANQSAGMTLQVSSAGGTNTGTLEATAGATLTVLGGTYTQTGSGKFLASGANSEVLLDAASITGGTLTATSGGKFVAENNSTLTGLSISSGTTVNLLNGNELHLGVGTITSKGTINVGSTGNFTALSLNGNLTLAGTGKIIFSANANNFILGTGTLTNQETIEGEGNIGDGQIGLVNTGSILANETGTHTPSTLFIDTNSSGFSNSSGAKNGILNVSAKNTIIIEGGPFNNFSGGTLTGGEYLVSGELEFNAGSATGIVTNNATITLTGATAEILNTFNSTNALTSFATNGAGATFGLAGGAKFVTSGNFTNNGTLNIGSGDKFSVGTNGANNLTNFNSGTSTLTGGTYIVAGTGQIQFNNGGDASDIVTNDANITLTSTSATNSFIDQSGNNALANFATNGATGSFTLTTDRNFTTGGSFTNAGIVAVSKSTGAGHTQLTINGGYSQTGGTTTVDGLLTTSTGIDISGGFFYGNADTLTGNFELTGGTLNPGDGLKKIGDVNITGTYTESGAGILNIDLDGITADTKYDVLNISGAATLGGTLNVDTLAGFTLAAGDSFDILNYASETGAFSTVNLPTLTGGDTWNVSYNSTDLVITVEAPAAPAAKGTVSASPAHRVSRAFGDTSTASTHEPSAILSRATCFVARMIGSASCGDRSLAATVSHGGDMHEVASARTELNSVHNNVMVATRSMSAGRGGASHETSASGSAMARLYVCAYVPLSVTHTMGCD